MNKAKYKILLILWFTSIFAWANPPTKGKYLKEETIQKTFRVNSNANVHIDNTYGNLNISGWNKNEVKIVVKISVSSDDSELVESKLKDIEVELSGDMQNVYAKTNVKNTGYTSRGGFISFIFGKKTATVNFKINYEVKIPLTNNLDIKNDYGNIYIDELQGNLYLKADYGKFSIGDLTGNKNIINVDYFTSSDIDFIKTGKIYADYSHIDIGSAYNLAIESDYTKIKIGKIRNLNFANDYGSIKVDNAMNVKGSGDYQSRYFGNIDKLDFTGDYGSIKIEGLRQNFESVYIKCDYTNIRIINSNQTPYQFTLNQEYGCFKYDELKIYKQIEDGGDKFVEAVFGNENTKSKIRIITDYGCVKLIN